MEQTQRCMPIHFNSSQTTSLGIEMELELVDAASRELHGAASEILGILGSGRPDGDHPKAKHELL